MKLGSGKIGKTEANEGIKKNKKDRDIPDFVRVLLFCLGGVLDSAAVEVWVAAGAMMTMMYYIMGKGGLALSVWWGCRNKPRFARLKPVNSNAQDWGRNEPRLCAQV